MIGHVFYILYNLHDLAEVLNEYVNATGIAHRKKYIMTTIILYGIDKDTYNL